MRKCSVFFRVRSRLECSAVLLLCLLSVTTLSFSQMETATLSGTVMDQSGAVVADAEVQVTNSDTNIATATATNRAGVYVVSALKPGRYRVLVSKQGFKQISVTDVILNVQDVVSRNFNLQLGAASETVSVSAAAADVHMSPAVVTVVDQRLVQELPLNGRSFQALFQLTPGVVIAPTSFADQGQFSVNGQRTNANYFTVDGAGANVGVAAGSSLVQTAGGSLPAMTAFGGTNGLVSTDAVQEFAIQTSSYSAEFGRTPGGQVSIVTRSGTNEFHGDMFDYFRNDALDANDWFSNALRVPRAALRQNDFGGVAGGPIFKNNSFFFASYEGLRLRQPTIGQSDVPTVAARQSAPASIRAFFNAYPLPTGPEESVPCDPMSDPTCPPSGQKGAGFAPSNLGFSNPSSLDAGSIRLDHRFSNSLLMFGRYNYAASDVKARGGASNTFNTITETPFRLQTLTLGLSWLLQPTIMNDLRFNWSKSSASSFFTIDNFGGAVALRSNQLFPTGFSERDSAVGFVIASGRSMDLELGKNVANVQQQINLVDNISWQFRSHSVKVGIDYRRLTPTFNPSAYAQEPIFGDVPSALALTPLEVDVLAKVVVHATFNNYSLYVQDNWRATSKLNLSYGVRWDYNPAPTGRSRNGLLPAAIEGIQNLSTLALAPSGTPLYHATIKNLAPRLGFAYQLRNSPGKESVIRAGTGIFYDLGSGPTGNAFAFFPFDATKRLFDFPLSASEAAPPPVTTNPPFDTITGFPKTLKLPYTYQWNLSIEQSLGTSQTLTLAYLGSAGHRLLRTDLYTSGLPPEFTTLFFVTNAGFSNYNALQIQLRRRTTRGLDILASYTLSHALDNVSSESVSLASVPSAFAGPRADYASSDLDIRNTGSVGIDYQLPDWGRSSWPKRLLGGWSIDPLVTARSSPTVNVVVLRDIGFGFYNFRPDLVPGVPLYQSDLNLPGERRINAAAFSVPSEQRQGNLGRNFFRGFPLVQIDIALRRRFRLTERFNLQASVEAFNLFNHPNFSPEANQLGTVIPSGQLFPQSGFGTSQSTLAQGLQTGSFGSGFSHLYQLGGPRSAQLALKLQF
jgi:hypothetical protein